MNKTTQDNALEYFTFKKFVFLVVMLLFSKSLLANGFSDNPVNGSIPCNSVSPIPMVAGVFDNLTVTSNTTGGCVLGICGIVNEPNLIDANLSNFSTAFTAIGLGVTHSIKVTDGNDTYAAGTFAGYRIAPNGGLSVDLLNNISIKTYLGGVLKETMTGISLASINLAANPGNYIVGFNTTQSFDAIEISISSLVGAVTSTNVFYPVVTTYCAGPNLGCNTPTAMNYPVYPTTIDNSHTGVSGISVGSVTNTENVLSANTTDYGSINFLLNVAGSGSISVKDQVTDYPAGTYAGFDIENVNLVNVSALGNFTVRTFLNGVLREQFSGNNLLVNGNLLSSGGRNKVGFVTAMTFDEVQISVNQLVGVNLGETRVYNASFENFCDGPALTCNTPTKMTAPAYPVFVNGANTGINGLVCALCSVKDVDNLIDANATNFATIDLTATVGTSGSIAVKNQLTDYTAGNFAGFDIESPGLLSVDALNAVTVSTYLNGTLREFKSGTGALVSVGTDLLVATGRKTIGFTTTLSFDEVKITLNNTVAVGLGATKIYNSIVQKFCDPVVVCNQTYAWTNPNFPVVIDSDKSGINGVACVACAVNNSGNVLTASISDFANITLVAGVLATGSVAVADQLFTYPKGTFAGFTIKDLNNLIEVDLFQALTISTYNNGILQEARTAEQLIGLSLIVPILGDSPGFYNVGFKTTLPFDEIRITVGSLASVINNINVYGAFVNTKDSTSGGGSGTLDCISTNLSVVKTANNATPAVGSNVTFTIVANNAGPSDATGVVVNDILPSGYTFVSAAATAGTYDNVTGKWTIGNVAANTNQTLTITATVNLTGNYANTAAITGNDPDPDLTNNTSTSTPIPHNAIVANDDTATAIDGVSGGTAYTNVLINDTLNGQLVTTSDVIVSFVSSTNSNITLSGVNVIVAPGTPAGIYSLVYQICEVSNPANCDTATVFLTVVDATVPSISITKDGTYMDNNGNGIADLEDTIIYNFIVANTGNVALSNVTVTDTNATVSGGPLATLAVGVSDSTTFSASHTITQADINAGIVYNLATVTGIDLNGNPITATSTDPTPCTTCPTDPDCLTCTITTLTQTPKMTITKDGSYVDNNGNGVTDLGDTIVYTFVVTNTGNVALSNVTVTDTNATVSGGPVATLAVGASDATTFSASHTITQADINAGIVYNLATVTGTDLNGNPITATSTDPTPCTTCPIDPDCPTCTITTLAQTPRMTITKDGSYVDNNGNGITDLGDTIVYAFVVTNTGNVALSNVTVTDTNASVSGGPLATLAVGASDSTTFSASHTITQADINAGIVYNLATVTGNDLNGNPITATSTDPTPCTTCPIDPDCLTCTITTLTQTPKMTITKDGSYVDNNGNGITDLGDTIVYTFVVANTGNVALSNVIITDTNASVSGGPLATLAVGASDATTFSASHTITQADINAGIVYNLATVTGTDLSGNPITATSTDPTPCTTCPTDPNCLTCTITTLTQTPRMTITKDGSYVDNNGNGVTDLGDTIVYTFVVTNTGNVALSNVTVTDINATVSGGPLATLAVGASDATTFSASHTIAQADINAGIVYNLATVTGTDLSGNPITATSTDPTPCTTCPIDSTCPTCTITTLTQTPRMTITKDGSYVDNNGNGITDLGDTIVYAFVVTNTGNVPLSNVTITDTNATVSGGPLATLAVGASDATTFSASHIITQADINAGIVYNLATVTGTDLSGNPITATSTDPTPCTTCPIDSDCPTCTITTLTQSPRLEVIKTSTTVSYSKVGDVINYTISIKNTGNETLHQILVKDPLTGLETVIAILEPNGSSDFLQSYTVIQSDLDKGSVTNIATANGLTINNSPISATDDEIVNKATTTVDTINAIDDVAGPIDGINGATNIINVLKNDTLNTDAVNPADITLTLVTADPTGFMTMNPNGSIDLKDGTPAGTYTLAYQICENANAQNCDTATVTVNVICNNTTKIAGVVFNVGTKTPIANVPVTLIPQGTTTGPILIRITDAKGHYNFTGMVAGSYLVQIQDANLNSVHQLYPVDSSLFFTTLETCKYQTHDFGYDKSDLPVLGDFVWYDLNGNGVQDEWYDANNDNLVTKNIPDANGSFDYSKWEWMDLNGDGSYKGPSNVGELNAAGFGNAKSANIFVTGPNNYSRTVIIGVEGYWRNRPTAGVNGTYKAELKMDSNLDAQSSAMGATGLVKILPSTNKNISSTKTGKASSFEVCGVTSQNPQSATISATGQVHLDLDFGINCKMFADIQANNDTYNVTQCSISNEVRNALSNDLLNGKTANVTDFKFKLLTNLPQDIGIDSNGNVSFTNGVAAGEYSFDYQVCEAANPTNCATATIKINVAGSDPVTITSATCNADSAPIDLTKFLPAGIATNGNWIDIDSSGGLEGSILNAAGIPVSNYKYEYKIADNCPSSIILTMNVNDDCKLSACESLVVHNVVTRNNDGKNDYFDIENISSSCYYDNSVAIFNRWGVKVFDVANYDNVTRVFTGLSEGRSTINQSAELPDGTYYYVLKYKNSDGNPIIKNGYLYLSR